MQQLFETVLILSILGLCLTVVLLVLKPITVKKFPAKWQYWVWIAVMLSMLVPVFKFIPKQEAQKLVPVREAEVIKPEAIPDRVYVDTLDNSQENYIPDYPAEVQPPEQEIPIWNFVPYIWSLGMAVYWLIVGTSYGIYLAKRRKNSAFIQESTIFDGAKAELGIKRKIRLKMCGDISSPMLVGMLCPTVYVPCREMNDENMRMIFLHELTNYRRRDLLVKWLAVFVNGVHWFNPFAYILCANVGEACELSCDMAVTKNMTADEQKIYMKTILDLSA